MSKAKDYVRVIQGLSKEEGARQPTPQDWLRELDRAAAHADSEEDRAKRDSKARRGPATAPMKPGAKDGPNN